MTADMSGYNDDIITLSCALIGLTTSSVTWFTDLVEDSQVLTLQGSGFMGETWRTDRQADRQVTIATVLTTQTSLLILNWLETHLKTWRRVSTQADFDDRLPGVHKVSGSRRITKFNLKKLYLHPWYTVEIEHTPSDGVSADSLTATIEILAKKGCKWRRSQDSSRLGLCPVSFLLLRFEVYWMFYGLQNSNWLSMNTQVTRYWILWKLTSYK